MCNDIEEDRVRQSVASGWLGCRVLARDFDCGVTALDMTLAENVKNSGKGSLQRFVVVDGGR